LAYQHDVAQQASPTITGDRPARRQRRPKLAISAFAAVVLAVLVAIPATAYWPVANRYSYLSRGFTSYHKADDIAASGGSRIVPMRSGKVVFAGWKSNCGGYQVWVSHGNGLYSAYYHMSKEVSWAGRAVTGQTSTLGYVGRTGCATGNHVHVEVWHGYPWRSGSYRVNPW
jgi:murein DD-endopeptidase MepM/ murein hydrolase activator NlpD